MTLDVDVLFVQLPLLDTLIIGLIKLFLLCFAYFISSFSMLGGRDSL